MTNATTKAVNRSEAEIRDYLADHLDLIEPGLTLIKKEEYLPNDHGAAGFIDIFARSASGSFVVIEIKRSDAAARQSVQELSKYAYLLKMNKLIKDHEFRLIVLSTVWNELLVPFSEFVHATRYDCYGGEIILGLDGLPVAIRKVSLLPPARTRRFSTRHFIWEFMDEVSARKSISQLAAYMDEVGIKDFVVVLLTLVPNDFGVSHLVYFAQQELLLEEYMEIIERRHSPEEIVEFKDWISGLSEMDDKVSEAADKAWEESDLEEEGTSLHFRMRGSSCQISHPEKARSWFVPERTSSVDIFRFGRFVDEDLKDKTIIQEIMGRSSFQAHAKATISSKPEVDALLAVANDVFFFNSVWRSAIHEFLAYAKGTQADEIEVAAFNNDDILSCIAGCAIGSEGFAPCFRLEIRRGEKVERYFGSIEWNGRVTEFKNIVDRHFYGDCFNYFLQRHFGEHRTTNSDVMADLGVIYTVERHSEDGAVQAVRVQGNSIVEIKSSSTTEPFGEFFNANEAFVEAVVGMFLEHDYSFMSLFMKMQAQRDGEAG